MLKRQSACNQFQRIGIETITKTGLNQTKSSSSTHSLPPID
jgi:hypothetical protein